MASLERAAFVRRLADGRYRLGPALLQLGQRYQASFRLEEYVTPILKRLSEATGESASFYVPEGDRRICLFRVNSTQHRVLHYVTPGAALPIHTGASGRVLMAYQQPDNPEYETVRRELLVSSLANRKSDTAALACPVFAAGASLAGALSLAGPRTRFTEATAPTMRRLLLEAAAELSEALGGDSSALRRRVRAE
jgi:DNA-binding IclR family transcriptional regulator